MSNPHKGEVSFDHGGKTYKLVFSANALCEMEDLTGEPAIASIAAMGDPTKAKIKTLRAAMWAALRDHHEQVSLKEAGNIVTGIGMAKASSLIGQVFSLAFPVPEGDRPLGEQPASQQDGTGKPS
jgi:hypothetical protein